MTAQLHENMIYEGQEVSMFSFPGFPEDHPRIIELTDKQIWAKGEPRRVSSNWTVITNLKVMNHYSLTG